MLLSVAVNIITIVITIVTNNDLSTLYNVRTARTIAKLIRKTSIGRLQSNSTCTDRMTIYNRAPLKKGCVFWC